jgi:predicted glycoside hydrolase/deacetylase ChbG (UPF0249 family)
MADLEELGFAAGERVVVVHVDDLGMSSPANRGGVTALEATATCGSIMVPCPAFEEIAEIARRRPELDLGVHLTLNAEYEAYRWGSVRDDVPGLISPDGGMWMSTAETVANATAEEVSRELHAQVDRAYEAGIDITHLDSHMGTVFDLKFVEVYFELAREHRLPIFIPRVDAAVLEERGMSSSLRRYVELVGQVEAAGFPVFDHFETDSLSFDPGTGAEHNRARLKKLGGGLSDLITHCAQGDDELASICPDWRQRDEEHRIYSDGTMAAAIEAEGIRTIGMRPLRDTLRKRI